MSKKNNIAVVRTLKQIDFNQNVGAASISPPNDPPFYTTVLQLCGFNPIKLFDATTISPQECAEKWIGQGLGSFINDGNICLDHDSDSDGLNVCINIHYFKCHWNL